MPVIPPYEKCIVVADCGEQICAERSALVKRLMTTPMHFLQNATFFYGIKQKMQRKVFNIINKQSGLSAIPVRVAPMNTKKRKYRPCDIALYDHCKNASSLIAYI